MSEQQPTPDYGEPWEFAEWNAGVNRSPGYGLLSLLEDVQVTVHTTKPDGLYRDRDCTDAAKHKAKRIVACINACAGMADPQAEIAKLRRERDEAREDLENWKATGIHTCHAGCKRPLCVAHRQMKTMREAIKEAHYALRELRSFYIETTNLPPCAANAALAKLQPFIETPKLEF